MSSYVPDWAFYGDGVGNTIFDICTRLLCLFAVFGVPILFFVVWLIDDNIYHNRRMAAREVKAFDNLTKAGAKFETNCVNHGVDYALYIWILDELKSTLDFSGYSETNIDVALLYIPLSIDEVFGGTSLHDKAMKLFESQEDYFRKALIG
jgi:hypothetical protein|nr:MAG TPA: hypothetical protein [Caudoviricetes sp.]